MKAFVRRHGASGPGNAVPSSELPALSDASGQRQVRQILRGPLLQTHRTPVALRGGVPAATLQRTPDVDDPTRFTQVHEALFVNTPSGGTLRPWVNPDPGNGVAGTAEEIKSQFITALRAHIAANPLSVGGTVPTRTTESQAETTAIAVDQDIRATFSQITTPLPESRIRDVVDIIQNSQTSDIQFLNQWLENRLSLMTDIDEFNIRTTDPRYEQMLADILADSWAGPNVRTLASRRPPSSSPVRGFPSIAGLLPTCGGSS